MSQLERQIRATQRRLWLNRWLLAITFAIAVGGAAFAVVVLVQRLWNLPIPLGLVGVSLAVVAVVGSGLWTLATREGAAYAAARLDEAAGLRERISSGQYCTRLEDPFAHAVVLDAERISSSITPRKHIRLTTPRPLGLSVASVVMAAAMFLITPGVLRSSEAEETRSEEAQAEQVRIAVKREMENVRRIAETTPLDDELKEELDRLNEKLGGELKEPGRVRHEAIKKLDKLTDALKDKREKANYEAVRETRKMLRGLEVPKSSEAPTQKLAKALKHGDFKTAKEEITKLQEQLATLRSEEDKKLAAEMSKQLKEMAEQLEKLAKDTESIEKKLADAGLKKEEVKRLLERLKKEDIEQIKKELQQKGMSEQQAQQMAKQMQQRQQAAKMGQQMAQGMGQAAKGAGSGDSAGAAAGLAMAADQLSGLEQLEQEMMQLEAAMAQLQSASNQLGRPCSKCNGAGCGDCGSGRGPGMGRKMGQGRGGLAPEAATDVAFKSEKAEVETTKGAIIGQFLVEGEQIPGEASESVAEVVMSAERDATDRVNRNRVPRQYHKSIRQYFSNVQRSIKDANIDAPGASGAKPEPSDGSSSKPADGDE